MQTAQDNKHLNVTLSNEDKPERAFEEQKNLTISTRQKMANNFKSFAMHA
jgi:hypothetical protein